MHSHKELKVNHLYPGLLCSEENLANGLASSVHTNLEMPYGLNTRVDLCRRCWARKGYGAQSEKHFPRVGQWSRDREHRWNHEKNWNFLQHELDR